MPFGYCALRGLRGLAKRGLTPFIILLSFIWADLLSLVAFVSQQKLTIRSAQPTIFRGIKTLTECHERVP